MCIHFWIVIFYSFFRNKESKSINPKRLSQNNRNHVQHISVKKDFLDQQKSLKKVFGYSEENQLHAILENFNSDQKGCQDVLLKLKEELSHLEYKQEGFCELNI